MFPQVCSSMERRRSGKYFLMIVLRDDHADERVLFAGIGALSSKSKELDKLQSPCSKEHHSQKDDTVFPSLDVGVAIESLLVANGNIDDFEALFVSAKKQIKVAERIEIPEVGTSAVDAFVILAPQHLGTAKRILYRLSQQPRKNHTETLVRT
jgi:hypothetical protein